MSERLTFKNFFTKPYLLDTALQDLDTKDHKKTLFCSIILGIFTLGLIHLGYVTDQKIKKWSFKPTNEKDNQTKDKTQGIAIAQGLNVVALHHGVPLVPPLNKSLEEERERIKEKLFQIEEEAFKTKKEVPAFSLGSVLPPG